MCERMIFATRNIKFPDGLAVSKCSVHCKQVIFAIEARMNTVINQVYWDGKLYMHILLSHTINHCALDSMHDAYA